MTRPLVILLLSLTIAWPLAAMEPPPNLDTALEAQFELVAKDPRNPVARNDLGNLLALAGRYGEAEGAYRKGIELSPADTAPRFNLALLYQETGRNALAQAELEGLLEIAPNHAWAHYQLGVLAARKSREKALNHYAKALALDPGLSFASNNPHILDNPLFGEALLRSQRYRDQPAANVPRQYGEAQRIIDLMLPPREEATAEARPKPEEDGQAQEGAAQEGEASGDERPGRPVASASDSTERSPDSELEPTRSVPATTRSAATTPTASSSDRGDREAPSYTSVGTPDASRPDSRTPPEEGRTYTDRTGRTVSQPPTAREPASGRRLIPSPSNRDGSVSRPGEPKSEPPPRSRYIPPSRRSTAQLELKLVPESSEKSG